MRAYRSCASARWGWRSSPVNATRCAASSCRRCRSSSPRRRNTRLSGSWASWDESALTSSAMDARPRPGEGLGRRPGALDRVALRQLRFRAPGEPLPLVPLLHRFREAPRGGERISQHAMGAVEQLRRALRLDPLLVGAHRVLGYALAATGRFTEAVEQWDQWERLAGRSEAELAQRDAVQSARTAAQTLAGSGTRIHG